MHYRNIIDNIKDSILSNKGSHSNWIIIGDNSSGKSELLKEIVETIKESRYYIDSVNRFFDTGNVSLKGEEVTSKITPERVVVERLKENKFNLNDSFGETEKIWDMYPLYEKRLTELIKKFLIIDFEIKRIKLSLGGESNPKVFINGIENQLSNGYQAIVRLFAELLYFCEISVRTGTVIIDEIDELLSPSNASKLFEFITEEFMDQRFILSTHSSDLLASSKDYNLVVLQSDSYSVYDGNDFCSITDVDTLLLKTYKGSYIKDKSESIFI